MCINTVASLAVYCNFHHIFQLLAIYLQKAKKIAIFIIICHFMHSLISVFFSLFTSLADGRDR